MSHERCKNEGRQDKRPRGQAEAREESQPAAPYRERLCQCPSSTAACSSSPATARRRVRQIFRPVAARALFRALPPRRQCAQTGERRFLPSARARKKESIQAPASECQAEMEMPGVSHDPARQKEKCRRAATPATSEARRECACASLPAERLERCRSREAAPAARAVRPAPARRREAMSRPRARMR